MTSDGDEIVWDFADEGNPQSITENSDANLIVGDRDQTVYEYDYGADPIDDDEGDDATPQDPQERDVGDIPDEDFVSSMTIVLTDRVVLATLVGVWASSWMQRQMRSRYLGVILLMLAFMALWAAGWMHTWMLMVSWMIGIVFIYALQQTRTPSFDRVPRAGP